MKIVETELKTATAWGGQEIASAFEHPNREANTDVDAALYEVFAR